MCDRKMAQVNLVNKAAKKASKKAWRTVKIRGNVISEEGIGLEGLIGLEVLESYDKNIIEKEKKPKTQRNVRKRDGSLSEHSLNGDDKKPKKKKKKTKKETKVKNDYSGKCVFLKPPQNTESEEDECHSDSGEKENTTFSKLSVDDLEGWNGLGVPDKIIKAIAENGFQSPTQIQHLTLPAAIMGKKDILGAAETGSGKTLAFGIPLLTGIMELKKRNVKTGARTVKIVEKKSIEERENFSPSPEDLHDYPELPSEEEDDEVDDERPLYGLILTPTRELAVQVKDHLVAIAKYTGIKVDVVVGGLSSAKQERVLKQCPEVVVATPGRLWELISEGNPHLNKLEKISFLVIDETDRMVEKGHFEELRQIMKLLNNDETKKQSRQNFVFSATLTLVHDLPDHLQKKNVGRKRKMLKPTSGMKIQRLIEELGLSQPKIVDITGTRQTVQTLTESRIICPIDHKDYYLYYFVQRHSARTIVFCNSIGCVKRLGKLFNLLDCQPLPLHASMIQKQRLKNLEKFTSNPRGLLIATDVAARGLDIPDVQHVIHYQVPRTSENYVHRSGRTARANKDGITVILMEPGEVKNYLKLCKTLDRKEDLPLFPVADSHLKTVKERVNLARDIDTLELKNRRMLSETGWLKKTAEEMDIVLENEEDDENISDDENLMERVKQKNLLATKRQQLMVLLNKPLFPKGFSYKYPTSTGKLALPFVEDNENKNSAIKVMKDAMEEMKAAKKARNKKKNNNTN